MIWSEIHNHVTKFKLKCHSEAKTLFDPEPLFYRDLIASHLQTTYGGQQDEGWDITDEFKRYFDKSPTSTTGQSFCFNVISNTNVHHIDLGTV